MDREILLIADPMCSWCWGFAPVFASLTENLAGEVPVSLRVGGLRPYTKEPWDKDLRNYIREAWAGVATRTGQGFNLDLLNDHEFVYDTEPACRAVVTARHLDRESAVPMLHGAHRAFYVDNHDITQADVLADLAEELALNREAFLEAFDSNEAKQTTYEEFKAVQAWGVKGFPTLLLREGRDARAVATGYRPFAELWPDVEAWLAA
ncbi:DsbA family protein [Magnetospira sp. QH-2]|uniref:DsbA family protein n=1 Tax=Magnetospira sp. (strain QH-2) TaxID=1288970 RepID=UPI0003E816F5|nr:DsbA family protein [Magnetospira sp. QH-2]CCQ72248.1 Putative Thioredoxin-like protein (DSBA family) [Magnetospira sp. QH-2]